MITVNDLATFHMNSTSDCGQRVLVACILAPRHDGKLRKII